MPAYLLERSNTIRMILFTVVFALLFINIFEPFNSRNWYPNISEFSYFFFSSLIILTGMLVVVISRLIMGFRIKSKSLNYLQYALWVLAEIMAMSLFFSLFSKYVPQGVEPRNFIDIFKQSFINTSLVLLLPYGISILYFSWKEKSRLLEEKNALAAETNTAKKGLIAFPDEKGELKISIAIDHLIYIDSADNYATIHYLKKDKLSNFLIRNSLKWMEENLTNDSPLVRCHRSYMVNLDKVKVLRKTKDGIFLELDAPNMDDIPVSKTYYEKVMTKFSKYTV